MGIKKSSLADRRLLERIEQYGKNAEYSKKRIRIQNKAANARYKSMDAESKLKAIDKVKVSVIDKVKRYK